MNYILLRVNFKQYSYLRFFGLISYHCLTKTDDNLFSLYPYILALICGYFERSQREYR